MKIQVKNYLKHSCDVKGLLLVLHAKIVEQRYFKLHKQINPSENQQVLIDTRPCHDGDILHSSFVMFSFTEYNARREAWVLLASK